MALTGKARVRLTWWKQKLILQVETSYEVWVINEGYEDRFRWRDATFEDVQQLGVFTLLASEPKQDEEPRSGDGASPDGKVIRMTSH